MKIIKDAWDRLVDAIDDIAANLSLQPKPIPVRIDKNKGR